jgi:hypothetical protein
MPPPDQAPYPGWQGPPRQGPAATAPAQRPDTVPVYPAQQPGYYQAGPPAYPAYYPPPPAKSGFKGGWIIAFIGIAVFGSIVLAILIFTARMHRRLPPIAAPPHVEVNPGPGESVMDETAAVVTPTQTQITKTFPLAAGASLSIKNTNGRIHVESWDGPGAQVTVTKVGGSEASRRRIPIYQQVSASNLSLHTGEARINNIDVSYEVKVPRRMGNMEIASNNGNIRLDGLSGDIDASSSNGNIDLNNINGSASAKNMNGSIAAVFDEVSSGKPMTFSNMNGAIRLQFRSDINANLSARTTTGSISLDSDWPIDVKKGLIGARADGPIGTGGQPLKVETMNGSISITKAPGSAGH